MNVAQQLTSEQKVRVLSTFLGHEVSCKRINNINYADFNDSDNWMSEKWLSGKMKFEPVVPDRINQLVIGKFVDPDSQIEFKILGAVIDQKTNAPMFNQLRLHGTKIFDLSRKNERAEAFIWFHQEFVLGSPRNVDGKGLLKVTSVEQDAKTNRIKRKKASDVMNLIDELEGTGLKNFANLLITVHEGENEEVIKDKLEELAMENPELVLKEFQRTDRHILETLRRAQNNGVVEFHAGRGYTYNGNNIGLHEIDILDNLQKNPMLLKSIHDKTVLVISKNISEVETVMQKGILKNIAQTQREDRSLSDAKIVEQESKNSGLDVDKLLKGIQESIKVTVDTAVGRIEGEFKELKSRVEQIDRINQVELDEIDEENVSAITENIDREIEDLHNGIYLGEDFETAKLKGLKQIVLDRISPEEGIPLLNMNKRDLFDELIVRRLRNLENKIDAL